MRIAPRKLTLLVPAAACLALLAGAPAAHGKVTASTFGHLLKVHGGRGSDRVTVMCSRQGQVKVNHRDPRTGAVACATISEVDVVTGAGNDRVNLSNVGTASGFGTRDLPGFGTGTGAAAQLGTGNDSFIGGASAFNLVLAGRDDDFMVGGGLRDDLEGGSGNDTARGGDGRDVMLGNSGNDSMSGNGGDDLISGNAGDDTLRGGPGADLIGGGQGKDTLIGGDGDDQLVGGPQKDRLVGGPGNNQQTQ